MVWALSYTEDIFINFSFWIAASLFYLKPISTASNSSYKKIYLQ